MSRQRAMRRLSKSAGHQLLRSSQWSLLGFVFAAYEPNGELPASFEFSQISKLTKQYRVEGNQGTHLLRLPAEIRGRIWPYVVEGGIYRPSPICQGTRILKYQFKLSPPDSQHRTSRVRVCR